MSLRVAIHDAGSASGIGQPMIAATFLTSVFVPVIDLLQAGFLDGWFATPMAILILWSALYRMAFVGWAHGAPSYVGFPAAWGVVAFYLHAFDATPGAAVLIVGIALVASLVPIPWPHPTQTLYWPAASRAVLLIWLLAAGSVLTHGFPASSLEKAVLLAGGLYACALAAMVWRARRIAV